MQLAERQKITKYSFKATHYIFSSKRTICVTSHYSFVDQIPVEVYLSPKLVQISGSECEKSTGVCLDSEASRVVTNMVQKLTYRQITSQSVEIDRSGTAYLFEPPFSKRKLDTGYESPSQIVKCYISIRT